jgi:hypothetical protein
LHEGLPKNRSSQHDYKQDTYVKLPNQFLLFHIPHMVLDFGRMDQMTAVQKMQAVAVVGRVVKEEEPGTAAREEMEVP